MDEALLAAVFDRARDAMLVLDDDGVIVGANAAAARLARVSVEELVGRPIFDLSPGEATDVLVAGWTETLKRGGGEGVWRVPDPHAMELEYVTHVNIAPGRHVTMLRDITGTHAEHEIHRGIVENAVEMISLFDLEANYVFVSPSYLTSLGRTLTDYLGHNVFEYLHEEDAAAQGPVMGRLIDEETIAWTGRLLHEDGTWRTLQATAVLIRDESGVPQMILSVARDVTEAQALEQSLRQSERRYRDLFENAGELIVVTDPGWKITSVNRAFLEAVGYPEEDVLGQDVQRFLSKTDLARARDRSADEDSEAYTIELRTRGAGKRVLEVTSRLIEEDGATVGMQAVARDITERVELEERLAHAQKMEALGRLAGGVSHDFNNLLTAMVGYADFALSQLPGGTEAKDAVEEVLKAAHRASALTAQLLAFSRRQVVDRQVLDPNAVVAEMGALLRRVIGEQIELELALSRRAGWVRSDRSQLEQILTNLVVNARDAIPPEGGHIVIATGRIELGEENTDRLPPGPYSLISVQDSGCGMDEDTAARIFEPFFTTKQPGQGTGLGLATVYGIVAQHGGAIQVASKMGEGSTFVVLLPEALASDDLDVEEPPGEDAGEEPGARILVVEDEEIVRNLVQAALERRGHEVSVAANGAEALLLCEDPERRIDLLLTDVVMPQLNGAELAERVAQLRPGLRIIFMSGYTRGTIDEPGLLQPGRAFLQKPFTVAQLLQTVGRMLNAPVGAAE